MEQLKRAEQIAREAHKGQKRRDGTSYINHPRRVANKLTEKDEKVVALLHDTLEDTTFTAQMLVNNGIPVRLVNSIKNLTRRKNENYYILIMRVEKDSLARKVKIADIEDNLINLSEGSMKDKYRLARELLKRAEDDI